MTVKPSPYLCSIPMYKRETLKEARYKYYGCMGTGEHILVDEDTGIKEVWVASKNFAGYALRFKNTHLEFVRQADDFDLRRIL